MANMASYGIFLVWISIYIGTVHGNCRDSECEHGCCGTYPDSHCCIGSNTPDCSSGPSCVYGCCKDGMGSYCCPAPIKKKPCEDLECDHGCCGDTDNQYCCAAPTPAPTLAPAPAPSDSRETRTIEWIVVLCVMLIPLKIGIIYCRIQKCRRLATQQQTITVREIRVPQGSSNPQHAGYDQPGRAPAQVIREDTATRSTPGGGRVLQSSGQVIRPSGKVVHQNGQTLAGGQVTQAGRQVLQLEKVLSTPVLVSQTLVTVPPLMHSPIATAPQNSAGINHRDLVRGPPPSYSA